MAVRYAINSGSWSDATIWNGGTLPTSSDDVYSNNFTIAIDQNIGVLSLRNTASGSAIAGGIFTLNSGVTASCTATTGIVPGTTTCLTYAGSGSSILNAIIGVASTAVASVTHTGTGTLTVNGNLNNPGTSVSNRYHILVSSSGSLNYTGTNFGMQVSYAIYTTGTGATVNHVGNLYGTQIGGALYLGGTNTTANITGDLIPLGGGSVGGTVVNVVGALCTINITGNIGQSTLSSTSIHHALSIASVSTVTVTGNCYGNASGYQAISTAANCFLKIVGGIYASSAAAVVSTGVSAINILTGPFISSPYGIVPMLVSRMHYQKTTGSYYEFRNSETTGALSPGPTASAVRLYSPDTLLSPPPASDVRYGVTFASGSFTGTLRMPSANQVAYGVPVDNTTGSAVITAGDVWNYLTANMTTTGSIGERIKNVATVDTTGQQLTSLT